MPERVEYPAMTASPKTSASPIKFGTSGWRGIIADDFTFATVRLAVTAIADHINAKGAKTKNPTVLVGYDTRFYSEEFSQLAVEILQQHKIHTLLCETFTPTPAIAYEITRRKLDGAVNFTASHNPAQYHGLKFSSADAGPALPEVTKDIEGRAARLLAAGGVPPLKVQAQPAETTNLRENYLKRLEQLVKFDVLANSKKKFVVDALHGCGAGYLNKILADHGVPVETIRADRDVLFDGTGPDVSEENLAPLRNLVRSCKATVGLATDGDADRFGIVDSDGAWIQPNLILALVYDYLVESR